MPLTQAQIEKRREGLGASDMAAVLGLDPFRTAYDVMAEKRGLLEDEKDGSRPWLEAGNLLEPAILEWARLHIGQLIVPSEAWRDPKGSCLAANPDAIVVATKRPVEAKSHLQYTNEHWGEAETDDVPARVSIQATIQMMCDPDPVDVCHVVVLLPVVLFVPYIIRLDNELADMIRQVADDFDKLKRSGGWPDAAPSANIIKRIRREPKSIVTVPDEAFIAAKDARQACLEAGKAEEEAMAALMQLMGTAEAAQCSQGTFTYLLQQRAGYTVGPTEYRVGRFKKA